MLSSLGFPPMCWERSNIASVGFLFSPFLLTDNAAFPSFKSCPHAFWRHLAPYLFFTAVSSLSHNLFQPLPESYSQRACLNRRSFTQVFSLLTLASSQVTSARAMHCFVTFVFFFYWLYQIHAAVKKATVALSLYFINLMRQVFTLQYVKKVTTIVK